MTELENIFAIIHERNSELTEAACIQEFMDVMTILGWDELASSPDEEFIFTLEQQQQLFLFLKQYKINLPKENNINEIKSDNLIIQNKQVRLIESKNILLLL